MKLTRVVLCSEKKDGSIDYQGVLTKVSNSELSIDWDNIMSDALPENVSLQLMNDVVQSFCGTCGRGFANQQTSVVYVLSGRFLGLSFVRLSSLLLAKGFVGGCE